MAIQVNMKLLSYRDLAKVNRILKDELGLTMAEVQESPDQALVPAAFAVVWEHKQDPASTLTFDEAAELPLGEIEVLENLEPSSGNNGAAPLLSPASGV